MPEFDSILFDFDGVLLDTEPAHWATWAEALAPLGISLPWEYYRTHCIGIDDREMLRQIAAQTTPPGDWDAMWARYAVKKALFAERMRTPPFEPALLDALRHAAERYKMAVVTSSATGEIEPLLVTAGIRPLFQTVVGGDSVTHRKPHPDPYLMAAARLGAKSPVVFEDSEAGIASGLAAGFSVRPVTHPSEVPELLRLLH